MDCSGSTSHSSPCRLSQSVWQANGEPMTSAEQRLWIPLRVTSWASAKLQTSYSRLAPCGAEIFGSGEKPVSNQFGNDDLLRFFLSGVRPPLVVVVILVGAHTHPGVNPRTSPPSHILVPHPTICSPQLSFLQHSNCTVVHGDHDFTDPCRCQEAGLSGVSERLHQGRTSSSMYCILPHDLRGHCSSTMQRH